MKKLFPLVMLTAILSSGCMTVTVSSKQFVPRDTNKLALLKTSAPDYQTRDIEFVQADGSISRGVYFSKPGAQATVLYFLGSGIRLDADGAFFLKPFADLNLNVIAFDYRSFGRSDATTKTHGLKEIESDTAALYDYARGMVQGRLIVHGHSFGSFVAAHLAGQRKLDGLVLEGTGTDARTYAQNLTPWFAKPFVSYNVVGDVAEVDNRRSLQEIQFPILIIAGKRDTTTPEPTARELFDGLKQRQKRFVSVDAGHMDGMVFPEAKVAYKQLLQDVENSK
ncbi:alpha/beta hydrolase [Undibacterium cyanobacteriorum]|uniref:Alpha/beta hydrolase n=1 Tax=Undibacterium cyanobacteriorum TaxID=3073561 RepID=A0ABY9RL33_9BURK|nr:alpha/beta hydrolase [Undibacterium sp. 20NA77.5]WMW81933.1 alpha/beta hydrolase [Undibacterium sp. 20NA77.5]